MAKISSQELNRLKQIKKELKNIKEMKREEMRFYENLPDVVKNYGIELTEKITESGELDIADKDKWLFTCGACSHQNIIKFSLNSIRESAETKIRPVNGKTKIICKNCDELLAIIATELVLEP